MTGIFRKDEPGEFLLQKKPPNKVIAVFLINPF